MSVFLPQFSIKSTNVSDGENPIKIGVHKNIKRLITNHLQIKLYYIRNKNTSVVF